MREILFRGKTTRGNIWVHGDCSRFTEPGKVEICYPISVDLVDVTATAYSHCDWIEVEPETVGQFTGLLDKNGKKIFEGDIIRIHNDYTGDLHPFNCRVMFHEGSFVCAWQDDIDDVASWHEESNFVFNHFSSWNVPLVWWEIVGNVYDNPELLENS